MPSTMFMSAATGAIPYKKYHAELQIQEEIKDLALNGNHRLPAEVPALPRGADTSYRMRLSRDPTAQRWGRFHQQYQNFREDDESKDYKEWIEKETLRDIQSHQDHKILSEAALFDEIESFKAMNLRAEIESFKNIETMKGIDRWDIDTLYSCSTPKSPNQKRTPTWKTSPVDARTCLQRSKTRKMSTMSTASYSSRYSCEESGRKWSDSNTTLCTGEKDESNATHQRVERRNRGAALKRSNARAGRSYVVENYQDVMNENPYPGFTEYGIENYQEEMDEGYPGITRYIIEDYQEEMDEDYPGVARYGVEDYQGVINEVYQRVTTYVMESNGV
jgi:hypothetical protein